MIGMGILEYYFLHLVIMMKYDFLKVVVIQKWIFHIGKMINKVSIGQLVNINDASSSFAKYSFTSDIDSITSNAQIQGYAFDKEQGYAFYATFAISWCVLQFKVQISNGTLYFRYKYGANNWSSFKAIS